MGRCTSSFTLEFGNETDVQGVYILDLNHMPVGCGSVSQLQSRLNNSADQ
jgi:hypothetical protein